MPFFRNKRRLFIAAIIGLILIKVLTVAWRSFALMQQVSAIVQFASLDQASERLAELSNAFGNLNGEVGFLYPVLRLMPGDPSAVPDLAGALQETLAAVKPLTPLSRPFAAYYSAPDAKNWAALLSSARQIEWTAIADRLHKLRAYRDDLVTKQGLSDRFDKVIRALDNGIDFGEAAVEAAPRAFALLADGKDHRVIVMAQNSDELRATGGFITALAVITIHADGRLESQFMNSYAIDNMARLRQHPVPPAPMLLYMDLPRWVFRDTNWSPDFPTAARAAARLYVLDQGQAVDVIAAVNLNTIRALVDAVGPLTLPNVPTPLDGERALQQMRQAWNIKPETVADSNAKDFLKPFVDALSAALSHSSSDAKLTLLATFRELLARRDVLLYAADPDLQTIFSKYGWTGELEKPAVNSDTLLLVDTNIGYNKVGPFIQQGLTYHISLTNPDTPFAQVSLFYRNTNPKVPCTDNVGGGTGTYEQRMIACYWDWIRLYAPAGARLLTHNLKLIPAEQMYTKQAVEGIVSAYPQQIEGADYTLLEGLALIPAGDEQTLRWVYQLPASVISHAPDGTLTYQVMIQRQSGAASYPLTVNIDLPTGTQMLGTSILMNGHTDQSPVFVSEHQTLTVMLACFEQPVTLIVKFREG